MLILILLLLLISNTVALDKIALHYKTAIISLVSITAIIFNCLYIKPFPYGLDLYNYLYNVSILTQSINTFIFIATVFILIFTTFLIKKHITLLLKVPQCMLDSKWEKNNNGNYVNPEKLSKKVFLFFKERFNLGVAYINEQGIRIFAVLVIYLKIMFIVVTLNAILCKLVIIITVSMFSCSIYFINNEFTKTNYKIISSKEMYKRFFFLLFIKLLISLLTTCLENAHVLLLISTFSVFLYDHIIVFITSAFGKLIPHSGKFIPFFNIFVLCINEFISALNNVFVYLLEPRKSYSNMFPASSSRVTDSPNTGSPSRSVNNRLNTGILPSPVEPKILPSPVEPKIPHTVLPSDTNRESSTTSIFTRVVAAFQFPISNVNTEQANISVASFERLAPISVGDDTQSGVQQIPSVTTLIDATVFTFRTNVEFLTYFLGPEQYGMVENLVRQQHNLNNTILNHFRKNIVITGTVDSIIVNYLDNELSPAQQRNNTRNIVTRYKAWLDLENSKLNECIFLENRVNKAIVTSGQNQELHKYRSNILEMINNLKTNDRNDRVRTLFPTNI